MKEKMSFETLALLGLCTTYVIIYLPLMMYSYPSFYRFGVQKNMKYVAETLAQGGNPYVPPYPEYYSTAGGHLHGVLGAPFNVVLNFPQSSRLGVFFMGLVSLIIFYFILKEIGVRNRIGLLSCSYLLIYPQYILFHTQGNPSAADIFFGLISVYAYLRWRTKSTRRWLVLSSFSAGLATFSHFYSGVVAIGIVSHYFFTTDNKRKLVKIILGYSTGMLPALGLFINYKLLFTTQDPNSHYINRLIINSFHKVYASNPAFPVYSFDFFVALFGQHGNKSPIFGHWYLTAVAVITIIGSSYLTDTNKNGWLLVLNWIVAGLLIVVIIPGGVIYHDYYTWWLLIGVVAGLSMSLESSISIVEKEYKKDSFATLVITFISLIVIGTVLSSLNYAFKLVTELL